MSCKVLILLSKTVQLFCTSNKKPSENPAKTMKEFARNVEFSSIASGNEGIYTFRALLNAPPTLATLIRDIFTNYNLSPITYCLLA